MALFLSCSSFENENNRIAYRWESNSLIVENGDDENIYYAVFEQELLAVIDWAPFSSEENRILGKNFVRITKKDIIGYDDGDTVVLFYWKGENPPYEVIESIEIDS